MSNLKKHWLSFGVIWLYELLGGNRRRSVAKVAFKLLFKLEGGQYRSISVRKLMRRDYSVDVGEHSYGECFVPGAFAPSVEIGRYVSIGKGVRVFTQNHPIDHPSTHPYFYECSFGVVDSDQLEPATSKIGHDVWIGQGAIILPGCRKVGTGAIIGAGSVVTKNVPDYAIVAGNPAKVLKYRFSKEQIDLLLLSRWWERPFEDLKAVSKEFCTPVNSIDFDDGNSVFTSPD